MIADLIAQPQTVGDLIALFVAWLALLFATMIVSVAGGAKTPRNPPPFDGYPIPPPPPPSRD